MTVTTRVHDPESDDPFLRRLILQSLTVELGADLWPPAVRDPLLEMQYQGRRFTARSSYPEGESRIILLDGTPAGWIYTAELKDWFWIAEIIVAAELRGRGVASAVLRGVIDAAGDKPVRLNVNVYNSAAVRLYEGLGFRRVEGDEVNQVMEYRR